MGKTTGISWADATHNFWYGCRKVSEGCKHCYAEREMNRFKKGFNTITRAKDFTAPLKWKEPRMVFTCSWSDFFISDADDWRAEAWNIIQSTPQHTYLILTKRPENIQERLPWDWGNGYKNVWLGVSAENQYRAEQRIPILLNVRATKYFVSAEPLLESINLTQLAFPNGWIRNVLSGYSWKGDQSDWQAGTTRIHWLIVGGESGPTYRHMNPEWALDLLQQCSGTDTAYFFKQMGGWPNKGGDYADIPLELQVREIPAE